MTVRSNCLLGDSALELMFWIVIERTAVDAQKNVSRMPNGTIMYRTPNELCPIVGKAENRDMSGASARPELVEQKAMRLRQCNHLETPTRQSLVSGSIRRLPSGTRLRHRKRLTGLRSERHANFVWYGCNGYEPPNLIRAGERSAYFSW
jgi:hypothetical protein